MIAERLQQARANADWTRRDLSQRSGVHQSTIADIEEGRNRAPSYEKVVLLARALGVQPDVLYPIPERSVDAA